MAIEVISPIIDEETALTGYAYTDSATPLDPGSTAGGFGQLQFALKNWKRSPLIIGTDVVLSDPARGRAVATVRGVGGDKHVAEITADSILAKFNVDKIAQPFVGGLRDLFQYYFDLAGIGNTLVFQAVNTQVIAPSWVGNLWDHIKWLLAAHQLEMSLVADDIVIRRPRQRIVDLSRLTNESFEVNTQTASQTVAVNYYNYYQINDGEVFPLLDEEPPIHQVDAGEVIVWEVQLNASLTHVNQPVHVLQTDPSNKSGTKGVYTVVGNDNLPVTPAQWADENGSIYCEITEDPSVLRVVIIGSNNRHLAPYRIAMSAGGTDYNSLHITGDGVAWEQRTIVMHTGADIDVISDEAGTAVDNPFISTQGQAFNAGQHTAANASGLVQTISGSAHAIDIEPATEQFFGNLPGARIRKDDAFYRITDVTINEGTIDYTAALDTTIGDFNKVWNGRTTRQFNEQWHNYSLGEASLIPLWEGD